MIPPGLSVALVGLVLPCAIAAAILWVTLP